MLRHEVVLDFYSPWVLLHQMNLFIHFSTEAHWIGFQFGAIMASAVNIPLCVFWCKNTWKYMNLCWVCSQEQHCWAWGMCAVASADNTRFPKWFYQLTFSLAAYDSSILPTLGIFSLFHFGDSDGHTVDLLQVFLTLVKEYTFSYVPWPSGAPLLWGACSSPLPIFCRVTWISRIDL